MSNKRNFLNVWSYMRSHSIKLGIQVGFTFSQLTKTVYSKLPKQMCYILVSCARRVNAWGLRAPAFAGQMREPAELCVRLRGGLGLNLLRAGRGTKRFFLRVTKCWLNACGSDTGKIIYATESLCHESVKQLCQPKCPTEPNIVSIFMRAAHWMAYFHLSKDKFSWKLLRPSEQLQWQRLYGTFNHSQTLMLLANLVLLLYGRTRVVRNKFSTEGHISKNQKTRNKFCTPRRDWTRGNLPMRGTW